MPSIPTTTLPPSFSPQTLTLSSNSINLLKSFTSQKELNLIKTLHASFSKSGLINYNVFVANSLLDSYSKCGHLKYAYNLFNQMPQRDIVTYTTLISACCYNGSPNCALSICLDLLLNENSPSPNEFTMAAVLKACSLIEDEKLGQALHGYIIKNAFLGDAFVCNSLIDLYSKMGSISNAEKLLHGFGRRSVVSWSTAISGCVHCEKFGKALVLFLKMLEDGLEPNLVTLLSIIRACSLMGEPQNFGRVHAWVMKLGLGDDALVANSLIEMYSKNAIVDEAMKLMIQPCILNGIGCFDPNSIAALVHGCAVLGSIDHGEEIHGLSIKHGLFPCTVIENSLMDLYTKKKQVASAYSIFQRMESKDIVSWNTMISCFANSDQYASKALEPLAVLHGNTEDGLAPDFISILCSIQACSELASLQQGQILHAYSIRSGLNRDVFISNSLIDMYSKSGKMVLAEQVFREMDDKDIGSWNSMIQAYGIHGDGHSALKLFTQLKNLKNHKPTAITFTNLISACSHSKLTKEGLECFESMQSEYNIEPTMEHYASMVDLLARSGLFQECENFINDMTNAPGAAVWGALLGACGYYRNVKVAERAAARLAVLEPEGCAWRVALANVYASANRWDDVGNVRGGMRMERLRKEAGWSLVEVSGKGRVKFVAGDTRHPETERIFEVWNCIKEHCLDAF